MWMSVGQPVTTTGSISDGMDGDIVVAGNASFTGSAITSSNDAGNTVNFGIDLQFVEFGRSDREQFDADWRCRGAGGS